MWRTVAFRMWYLGDIAFWGLKQCSFTHMTCKEYYPVWCDTVQPHAYERWRISSYALWRSSLWPYVLVICLLLWNEGTCWCGCLRHWTTSRKVACSIVDAVIRIFNWHNHGVDSAYIRNEFPEYFLCCKGGRALRLTILQLSGNLGASSSRKTLAL